MDDNEVSKLVENYLDKTSLDDPTCAPYVFT